MLQRFHPFGQYGVVKTLCEENDAFDDGTVIGVGKHVADETLVNLDDIHGQGAQVGQRGKTGAKVVQRKKRFTR